MRSYPPICALLLIATAFAPSNTYANDTAVSSDPGRVRILKHRSISMESETIQMRFDGPCLVNYEDEQRGMWHVEARYLFRNLSRRSQKVRLGFPESMCDPSISGCAGQDPRFQNFKTFVRDAPIETSVEQASPSSEWQLDRIWAYPVTFKPKERVEIVHRFQVVGWIQNGGGRGLSYLVKTGKNWKKPIGQATFRFLIPAYVGVFTRLPDQPWPDKTVSGLKYQSSRYLALEDQLYLELEYAQKNWTPGTTNVDIGFETGCAGVGYGLHTPQWDPRERARSLGFPKRYCDWKDLEAAYDPRTSTLDTLQASSSDDDVCIQAMYALRGKNFKDPYLQSYFYQGVKTPKAPPYPFFTPNPHYSPQLVQAKDKVAIALFEKVKETKAKKAAAKTPKPTKPQAPKPASRAKAPRRLLGCAQPGHSPSSPKSPALGLAALTLLLRRTQSSRRTSA